MTELTLFYHLSFVNAEGSRTIFYVGRTGKTLSRRLSQHKRDARKLRTGKGRLMAELMQLGYVVEITEIDRIGTYDKEVVSQIEDELIAQYSANGHKLYNSHTGNAGGIVGQVRSIDWTDEIVSDLGTMSDLKVAAKYNLGVSAVTYKRVSLRIPAHGDWKRVDNWVDYEHLLGQIPDTQIAKILGIDTAAVQRRRQKKGIQSFESNVWLQVDHLLGTMMDKDVGKIVGKSAGAVKHRRLSLGIPGYVRPFLHAEEIDSLLGTMSDKDIAQMFDTNATAISRRRTKLGIPPYAP